MINFKNHQPVVAHTNARLVALHGHFKPELISNFDVVNTKTLSDLFTQNPVKAVFAMDYELLMFLLNNEKLTGIKVSAVVISADNAQIELPVEAIFESELALLVQGEGHDSDDIDEE